MSNVKRVQVIGTNIYYSLTDTTARAAAQAALDTANAAKAIVSPPEATPAKSRRMRKATAQVIAQPTVEAKEVVYEEAPETLDEQLANVEVNLTMAAKAAKQWKAQN